MAKWEDTPSNRRYFIESLWALGISEVDARDLLNRARGGDFDKLIKPLGLTSGQIDAAKRMAVWRANPKTSIPDRIKTYLSEVMGYDEVGPALAGRVNQLANERGISRAGAGQEDVFDALYLEAAKELLSPNAFTQLVIKTQSAPRAQAANLMADVPAWNPIRTDQPRSGTIVPPDSSTATTPRPSPLKPVRPISPPGATNAAAGPAGDGYTPEAPPPPKPKTPAEIKAEIEASYGWAAGLLDIPEIGAILERAYKGEISIEEANNLFLGTQYYKTTTEAEREWQMFWNTDPQEAKTTWQNQLEVLKRRVIGMGLDPATVRLDHLTDLTLKFGWDDAQINRFLASEIKFDPEKKQAGIFQDLRELQQQWLVPVSDSAMEKWAKAIVAGDQTQGTFTDYLRTSAASMFPALAGALEGGITVKDYLDPYTQTIAKVLGMNDADVDWEADKFSRFINQIDPKTNERKVMSIADVTRTLRTDPTYGYAETAGGKAEAAALGRTILEDFGLRPTSGASFR